MVSVCTVKSNVHVYGDVFHLVIYFLAYQYHSSECNRLNVVDGELKGERGGS